MSLISFLHFCQWPGLLTGLLGAWFVSGTSFRGRFWGFFLWVLSDLFWAAFGMSNAGYGLVIMQLLYVFTSARGMWNNRKNLKS